MILYRGIGAGENGEDVGAADVFLSGFEMNLQLEGGWKIEIFERLFCAAGFEDGCGVVTGVEEKMFEGFIADAQREERFSGWAFSGCKRPVRITINSIIEERKAAL